MKGTFSGGTAASMRAIFEAAAKDFAFASIAATAEAALEGADGAVICTPPESHIALGRLAAERGAHLMVEKPFAQSVDGVEDLLIT